jgi:hypothetical protein
MVSPSLPGNASTPVQKLRQSDAASPDTRRPPGEPGPARVSARRSGAPCRHGFAPDTTTCALHRRRSGKWACRTCQRARRANRAETVRQPAVSKNIPGTPPASPAQNTRNAVEVRPPPPKNRPRNPLKPLEPRPHRSFDARSVRLRRVSEPPAPTRTPAAPRPRPYPVPHYAHWRAELIPNRR